MREKRLFEILLKRWHVLSSARTLNEPLGKRLSANTSEEADPLMSLRPERIAVVAAFSGGAAATSEGGRRWWDTC